MPGITDMRLIPRKVDTFAVVGGGILGSSIATALILSNYSVILKELDEKALLTGIERVKVNLQDHVKQGKLAEVKLDKILSLCKGVLHYEGFREVDMVIEAVMEIFLYSRGSLLSLKVIDHHTAYLLAVLP